MIRFSLGLQFRSVGPQPPIESARDGETVKNGALK